MRADSMPYLLTDEEIAALTGYQRPADQRRWLAAHGWTFVLGGDGRPKVARAHADKQLGALHSAARPPPQLRL